MSKEKKEYQVRRATLALVLGALGSRGVGFFREVVVAAKFGTGRAFDLYVAASAFPTFLSAIFLYALPDYLVPYFARLKENRPVALRRFLLWTFFGGAVFLGTLYFSAPLWVKLFAPGLPPYEILFGVQAFQILLLFVFGTAIEAILRSFYQVEGRFGLTAASPLLTGLIVLGTVFLLSGKLSVYALAWGWAVGSLMPVAVMLVFLFFSKSSGHLPPAAADPPAPVRSGPSDWKGFSYVFAVSVLGQMLGLLDRFFGSFLPPESLSAMYYASLPVLFPMGILIYPLGYAIFPKMAQRLSEGKEDEASLLLAKALGWTSFVLVPLTLVLAFQPKEVVHILYQRGVFGIGSAEITSKCVRIFAFSLLPYGFVFICNRVLLAKGMTSLLSKIYIGVVGFKLVAATIGVWYGGISGLCWAVVFSNWLCFFWVWSKLPAKVKQRTGKTLARLGVSLGIAFGSLFFISFWCLNQLIGLQGFFSLLCASAIGLGFLMMMVMYTRNGIIEEHKGCFQALF